MTQRVSLRSKIVSFSSFLFLSIFKIQGNFSLYVNIYLFVCQSRTRSTIRKQKPKDRHSPRREYTTYCHFYSQTTNTETQKVQAYRWHTITVKGRDCHTGTTDFANRADAMLVAATMICRSRDIASKYSALASTGILTLKPGSVNTVPGTVQFSLDIRASEDDRLMEMERDLVAAFDTTAKWDSRDKGTVGLPCQVEWQLDAPSRAVKFHEDCIRCVEESSKDLFGDQAASLTQAMTSGAGTSPSFTSRRETHR